MPVPEDPTEIGARVTTVWQPAGAGWRNVPLGDGVEGVVVDCNETKKKSQHCDYGPRVLIDPSTADQVSDIPDFHPGAWRDEGKTWRVIPS